MGIACRRWRFTVICFNLLAIDPPRPRGIFVAFVVDAASISPSTLSEKATLIDLALEALGNSVHTI